MYMEWFEVYYDSDQSRVLSAARTFVSSSLMEAEITCDLYEG